MLLLFLFCFVLFFKVGPAPWLGDAAPSAAWPVAGKSLWLALAVSSNTAKRFAIHITFSCSSRSLTTPPRWSMLISPLSAIDSSCTRSETRGV